MEINQDDIMTTLSYLKGERSVPTSNTAGRKDFIQRTLDEIYEYHPWPFANANATLSVVSGVATLPSGLTLQHEVSVRTVDSDDEVPMEQISVKDRHDSVDGDREYWIESQGDGTYLLKTNDSISQVLVNYQHVAPTINATIGTPFPDRQTIALGAMRWVKMSEDPNADISQDDVLYSNRLANNVAAYGLSKPRRKLRTLQSETGSATGDL